MKTTLNGTHIVNRMRPSWTIPGSLLKGHLQVVEEIHVANRPKHAEKYRIDQGTEIKPGYIRECDLDRIINNYGG